MKTNTKGFTLIELLAVIVILAVIALIASPIVLNIIQNSQKSARARSVEAYAHAIENTVATAMSNPSFVGGDVVISVEGEGQNAKTYACVGINAAGVGTCNADSHKEEVTYSGSKVNCSKVHYNADGNGYVELDGCEVGGSTAENYRYSNNPDTSKGGTNGKAVENEKASES